MKVIGVIIMALCVKAGAIGLDFFYPCPACKLGDKLVDLTYPFDETTIEYPGSQPFQLVITDRGVTEDGYWLQTEKYRSATHDGTHMDAPCHMVQGKWTMDQIPVNRFIAPAAVIDITNRSKIYKDASMQVKDLIEWEFKNQRSLNGTIILMYSGWGEKYPNEEEYLGSETPNIPKTWHFPGISPEAAEWIAENRNVYGVGVDTITLDNGRAHFLGNRKARQALFRANIFGMENIANLQMLPASGALLFALPMRIKESCGAPVRLVASLPVFPPTF